MDPSTCFRRALGLDVGGANLKAATADGRAWSESFPLWREPQKLADRLRLILSRFPETDSLAATMTGELADCFATKAEGVVEITHALEEAAAGLPLAIWTTDGRFVRPAQACESPFAVAAANWHALATWAGRLVPEGPAILLDVGSTTSDVIPLVEGRPAARGATDLGRLLAGELVYTGVRRTPVCAIPGKYTLRDGQIAAAAELFATTLDVYLLLDEIPEDETNRDTANGRPATRYWAADRIARAFCCDRTELSSDEIQSLVRQFAQAQQQQLLTALEQVSARFTSIESPRFIVSGSGSFLARRVAAAAASRAAAPISLDEVLTPELAESAPAYAVAVLAVQKQGLASSD